MKKVRTRENTVVEVGAEPVKIDPALVFEALENCKPVDDGAYGPYVEQLSDTEYEALVYVIPELRGDL